MRISTVGENLKLQFDPATLACIRGAQRTPRLRAPAGAQSSQYHCAPPAAFLQGKRA